VIRKPKTFGSFSAQQGKWEKMMQAVARIRSAAPSHVSASSHLKETESFGPNPGALRMFRYLPPEVSAKCALLVVLHGCTQSAESYDRGAGWSTLAERFGFALLLPEQQRSNNPNNLPLGVHAFCPPSLPNRTTKRQPSRRTFPRGEKLLPLGPQEKPRRRWGRGGVFNGRLAKEG
jgi:Esterase PHB depolymerase